MADALSAAGGAAAALGRMGVAEPLISSLEGMSAEQRAALVAGTIEGMAMADVATTLDTDLGGAYAPSRERGSTT